ncbi:MAG TPA: aminotransferase class V-fold PLP-dependent enzyme [Candidatus Absconditabacterales bacterium]|nr:aminotransferase class V-fold PLP-dependent enzyme [Candidatus Absconditabacterales bacterium]
MDIKETLPIFKNNPDLIYLDNAASTQKPQSVIDGVSDFIANNYANIHRGDYELSERSEELYLQSKSIVAEFLNCKASEIIYSYNSTYCVNLIAQSLVNSDILKKGDTVLLGIREHHANIIPRQILSQRFGFNIRFINIDDNYEIDRDDLQTKYDDTVKVVSIGHVSNVTGKIYDVKKIKSYLRDNTFFMIDGSQSFPNFQIDVQDIGCDCFIFTGHKVMAETGIGVTYLKKEYIKTLQPMISGGGAIQDVDQDGFTTPNTLEKFEAGTPNIIGAVSLLKALEYIKSIGGIDAVRKHEQELASYILPKFAALSDKVQLIGPKTNDRVAVFSFFIPNHSNFNNVGEFFASKNIAIRCGGHCAYPLHKDINIPGTCRMSAYIYNNKSDIDSFFQTLSELID